MNKKDFNPYDARNGGISAITRPGQLRQPKPPHTKIDLLQAYIEGYTRHVNHSHRACMKEAIKHCKIYFEKWYAETFENNKGNELQEVSKELEKDNTPQDIK